MLQKVFKTIKYHKLFPDKELEKEMKENFDYGYLVWFSDGSCKEAYSEDDLLGYLERDNEKRIRYIFNMADRIVIDRKIKVIESEEKKEE